MSDDENFDPFQDDEEDEAPPAKTPAKKATTRKTTAKKETKVAAENENENTETLSVTLKGGSGFDSPWIVVRAQTVSEMLDLLNDPELDELIDQTSRRGMAFAAKGGSTGGGGGNRGNGGGNRPAREQAPNGETRECKHGEMTFRSGLKNGRAWKAFMCPSPKGTPDQCPVQWLN